MIPMNPLIKKYYPPLKDDKPLKKKFWVLTLSTTYGDESFVFSTRSKAIAYLYEFVKEWWGECKLANQLNHSLPKDKRVAIHEYFADNERENYLLTQSVCDPVYKGVKFK